VFALVGGAEGRRLDPQRSFFCVRAIFITEQPVSLVVPLGLKTIHPIIVSKSRASTAIWNSGEDNRRELPAVDVGSFIWRDYLGGRPIPEMLQRSRS
jgi:hypothetical protein